MCSGRSRAFAASSQLMTQGRIVAASEMAAVERLAFDRGATAGELMDEVAHGIASICLDWYGCDRDAVLFCGKGHNAGDAAAAARILKAFGWQFTVRAAWSRGEMSELARAHLDALNAPVCGPDALKDPRGMLSLLPRGMSAGVSWILFDGLIGLGTSGGLRGAAAELAEEMRTLRRLYGARVVAMDFPSGLNCETGEPGTGCVVADGTIAAGFCKTGHVADAAEAVCGRLAVASCGMFERLLPEAADIAALDARGVVTTAAGVRQWLPLRALHGHKGDAGRLVIVAGSPGMHGAAALTAAAALKAGAGLVTVVCPRGAWSAAAALCPPEIMVRPADRIAEALDVRADALAIGPGLMESASDVCAILERFTAPAVIDAGALGMLPPGIVPRPSHIASPRLLTPHTGEMERLSPRGNRSRAQWATETAKERGATVLLKGARTVVAVPPEEHSRDATRLVYNATGNPGMASGGMGDVLTGTIGALLAGGMNPGHAASAGAWLCGRAADWAVERGGCTWETLSASDVMESLAAAYRSARQGIG